jgi:pimeloyl-ACP methyl ester carboxylesterase
MTRSTWVGKMAVRADLTAHAAVTHSRRMKLSVGAAVAMLLASVGLIAADQGRSHTTSLPTTLPKLCGLPDVQGAVMTFRAADGTNLVGAVAGRPGGRVGVVVANTADGEICNWVSLGGLPAVINGLVGDGDQVLLFDYRGTGRSSKAPAARSHAYDKDVLGAAAALRRRGAQQIVLIGGSLGGIVSLVAGAELKPTPAAVVGLSAGGISAPFANADGRVAAAKLHAPLLLVVAHNDELGDAKKLYRASSAKDKQLLVVPGSAHAYFGLDPAGPRVSARVLAFVRAHATS